MLLRMPRWDELTHRSTWAYWFRNMVVMEPLKRIAALTPWFDRDAVGAYCARQDTIWSQYLSGSTVLDAGCGPGTFIGETAERFGARSYVGFDISHGMVSGARHSQPRYAFAVASIDAFPFRDAACDVVVTCFTFHHVPVRERQACLSEMLRVARRCVIIRDVYGFSGGVAKPLYKAYYQIADGSYYRHTLDEWAELFESCGAQVLERADSGSRTIVRRIACWVLRLK